MIEISSHAYFWKSDNTYQLCL